MSANRPEQFFKPIGSRADEADALPEDNDAVQLTQTEQEEDGPIKEVESLCMKCHEQVTSSTHLITHDTHSVAQVGRNPNDAHRYTLLP